MKETRFLKRSKKFALGIALALGCNVLSMGLMSNVEAAEYNTQILGDNTADAVYIEAGIRNVEFIAVNTDRQALQKSKAPTKPQFKAPTKTKT